MSALNPQDLIEDSKCYACLGISLYDQFRLALLNLISGGGSDIRITETGDTRITEGGDTRITE